MSRSRASSSKLAAITLGLLCIAAGSVGCHDEWKVFRSAATPGLEAGINSILDGLVTGVFDVIEPDEDTSSTSSRSL